MEYSNRLPHMLQDYVTTRVREQEAEHIARKLAMRTRAEALEYQHETWEKLRKVFGPEPRRTPLSPRITSTLERRGYRVEQVLLESRPCFPVTGNLYVPTDREGPLPAVLGVCGHSMNGKAYESYQGFAQGLARKGYVTFIFDPLGQGERLQYPDGKGGSRYGGSVLDHLQAGNQQRLVGEWLGSWRTWDGIRALDYLLSREEVDPSRVGLTGCSGGGTLTTWLLACDRRFTMAAPSCYVTTWRRNLENELPADSEQNPPGVLALGLDVDDLLAMHAPRPLILLTEEHDFFDRRGAEEVYSRLQHLYELFGRPDNLAIYRGSLDHGYHKGQREAMYDWFNQASGQDQEASREPRLSLEPDAKLHVTPSGQVSDLGARNVADFTAETARKLALRRKPLTGPALQRTLIRLLALGPRREAPDYRILQPLAPLPDGRSPLSYVVETEPGIQAVLLVTHESAIPSRIPAGRQATIHIPQESAEADLRLGLVPPGAAEGKRRLCALDVRGIGDSRPNTCGGSHMWLQPYGSDFFYAYWLEMLGDSMIGRRVHDVLSVVDLMADRGYDDLRLSGRGWGSLVALLAATVDDRIRRVHLLNAPLSLTAMAQDEDYVWPLSGMLPSVLTKLDLPDCYRHLGKRVEVTEAWNSRCQVMPAARARAVAKDLGLPATLLR